ELLIGGLAYSPAITTVLKYHGKKVMEVIPGKDPGEPGTISAIFTDDEGNAVLALEENAWVGALESWDVDIEGKRITVRRRRARISLRLRLDPPGRIVIERLDMRLWDGHILATDGAFAIGRYLTDGTIWWASASIKIIKHAKDAAAIEFEDPPELELR